MDFNIFTNVPYIQKLLYNDNNIIDCDENNENINNLKCKKENIIKNCCINYKLKKIIENTELRYKIHSLNKNILNLKNKLFEYKNNYTNVNLINIKLKIEYEKLKNKNYNIIDCTKLNIYDNICPVCLIDKIENIIFLSCKHFICLYCYNNIIYFNHGYKCVLCRLEITKNLYDDNLEFT